MDSRTIDRRIRAFTGSIELTTRWIDGQTLRLYDCVDPDFVERLDLDSEVPEHIPGLVYYHKKRHLICIASAGDTWSAFRSMSLRARKKMSGLGFYNTFMRPLKKTAKLTGAELPVFIVGQNMMEKQEYSGNCNDDKKRSSDELKN